MIVINSARNGARSGRGRKYFLYYREVIGGSRRIIGSRCGGR